MAPSRECGSEVVVGHVGLGHADPAANLNGGAQFAQRLYLRVLDKIGAIQPDTHHGAEPHVDAALGNRLQLCGRPPQIPVLPGP